MISKGNHVKFARFVLLGVSEEAKTWLLRLRLITLTSTLIILDITKTSSNNCLWSIVSSYHSPEFEYVNFYIFTCILHLLRVYYEFTKWSAPSWLDSSVGRGWALHQYRRGHCFQPLSGLNCLSCANNCDDQSYVPIILRSSNIWTFVYYSILENSSKKARALIG